MSAAYLSKGSEYLNFPVWQTGTINIDGRGQSLYGQLAYNVLDVLEDKVLFRHTTCSYQPTGVDNGYTSAGADGSWGYYETRQEYFIQQDNGPLKQILLTKKSLLYGLKGKVAKLDARFTKGKLTVDQAIEWLTDYDRLSVQ